jgi:hypothetical protein
MGTVITIGGSFQITQTAGFDIDVRDNLTPAHIVDSQDIVIQIQGDIVADNPTAVWEGLLATLDQVPTNLAPQDILIQLDGGISYEIQPSQCLVGPSVGAFSTNKDDGAGDSHWKYSLTITAKLKGNHAAPVYELHTSITDKWVNKQQIEKTWTATCQAGDISTAVNWVNSYGPAAQPITFSIKREADDCRCTGQWVWELGRVIWIEETIRMPKKGEVWGTDSQIGDPEGAPLYPILFQEPNREIVIELDGIIRGYDPAQMMLPEPHWSETATMKRQWALERSAPGPVLEDPIRQIWRWNYQERWICTAEPPPAPNHGSHASNPQSTVSAPPDGPAATAL